MRMMTEVFQFAAEKLGEGAGGVHGLTAAVARQPILVLGRGKKRKSKQLFCAIFCLCGGLK